MNYGQVRPGMARSPALATAIVCAALAGMAAFMALTAFTGCSGGSGEAPAPAAPGGTAPAQETDMRTGAPAPVPLPDTPVTPHFVAQDDDAPDLDGTAEAGVDQLRHLMFADAQVSLNDRCIVRKARLNPRMPPMYVNGRPIGFC